MIKKSMLVQIAAILAITIFLALAIFQFLLFLGLPWGFLSYGGFYEGKLPWSLRLASLVAILIFLASSYFVSIQAGLVQDVPLASWAVPSLWVLIGFLAFNTVGNLTSKSKWERLVMTPLSLIAVICLLVVLLG